MDATQIITILVAAIGLATAITAFLKGRKAATHEEMDECRQELAELREKVKFYKGLYDESRAENALLEKRVAELETHVEKLEMKNYRLMQQAANKDV